MSDGRNLIAQIEELLAAAKASGVAVPTRHGALLIIAGDLQAQLAERYAEIERLKDDDAESAERIFDALAKLSAERAARERAEKQVVGLREVIRQGGHAEFCNGCIFCEALADSATLGEEILVKAKREAAGLPPADEPKEPQ